MASSTVRSLVQRVDAVVARWTSERTVEEAIAALEAAQVPCGAYRTAPEVAADPQVQAREMLAYVDLEHEGLERVPVSVAPFRLEGVLRTAPARPPHVGEHNDVVYRDELGYDDERLARLQADGVI